MMRKREPAFPKIYLYRRIVQAKLFIDRHYDRPIALHEIAGEAYFSKFHFIRLFREAYLKTPHQYLIALRIEKAKALLQEDQLSVAAICFEVGFDSLGSFSSLFKRKTGQTPKAFRACFREKRSLVKAQPLCFVPGCFARASGWTP